jgi:cystathionine beta-lyase/cystathionine gamma-synthase
MAQDAVQAEHQGSFFLESPTNPTLEVVDIRGRGGHRA